MGSIHTEEYIIETSYGKINAKKWTPDTIISEIPVVLLHDSLGCIDLWRGFPEILADNISRTVIAYDRLGFGKSDERSDTPSLNFIEEEAIRYFPEVKSCLSLSEYLLMGHSVGGPISINIAVRDNDCKAVITIASQSFVEETTLMGVEKTKREFESPGQIERLMKWHGNKAQWVLDAWTDKWASQEFSSWNLDSCIGKVVCPVFSIHGANDEYGSTALAEYFYEKSGGVTDILILQDCGHMPHMEKTEKVVNSVKEFISVNCRNT